jgi:hypothetical protein
MNNDRVKLIVSQQGDTEVRNGDGYMVRGRGGDVVAFYMDSERGSYIGTASQTIEGYPEFTIFTDEGTEEFQNSYTPTTYVIPELVHYSFHTTNASRGGILSVALVKDSEKRIEYVKSIGTHKA